jgi:archaellum component FlaC
MKNYTAEELNKEAYVKEKIEAVEQAIKELEDIYTPSTETYKMKRELLQQYRKEWYELKQQIKNPGN